MLIKARMRVGTSWSDACILNLSSRGMLVQAGSAPQRGNYLEIRRGPHVVVARVVWAKDQRFGVCTQDRISADELVGETDNSSATHDSGPSGPDRRRHDRRTAGRHEASRIRARAFEFATLAAVGAASAFLLFGTIGELLGRPVGAIEAALTAGKSG